MAWTKVQGTTAKTSTSTSIANNAWGSSPTLNNLLVMTVLIDRSSAVSSANAVSGWTGPITLSPSNEAINSTRHIGVYIYWRVADGSNTTGHDAAPSVTISANSGAVGWCDEFSGGDSSTPHEADGALQDTNATSGTITCSVVTTTDGDLVYTVCTGNSGVQPSVTWGGGATADRAMAFFNTAIYYASATQTASAHGTISPTAAISGIGSTGLPIIAGVSIAFKPSSAFSSSSMASASSLSGTLSPLTTRKVRQAGAWVTAARKVRQSGAWVAATRRIRQSGQWV
jgi:hypothetical protein